MHPGITFDKDPLELDRMYVEAKGELTGPYADDALYVHTDFGDVCDYVGFTDGEWDVICKGTRVRSDKEAVWWDLICAEDREQFNNDKAVYIRHVTTGGDPVKYVHDAALETAVAESSGKVQIAVDTTALEKAANELEAAITALAQDPGPEAERSAQTLLLALMTELGYESA